MTKITGAIKNEMNSRVKALPKQFQTAFYEISKYLYQFASSNADILSIQIDILDIFESGVREGKDVFSILGKDIIGFCDGLLGGIPEQTWIGKMKFAMNQKMEKKLRKD